ncbi:arylsulfatase [Botrimarina mediterranea]|uniref:Arylsulfatase n=1 Tax=Botrimarina mediterranea TaxID=2528022 RepID=A0A518K846_9BACT|nr:arylsulfatase [Botrimarina mediterranea]QDV73964.1 Arylsulfatase [Botrimarina mediterranea]QDV78594.1 Arylsulfatase [Planctomycetes bacterium K2D]
MADSLRRFLNFTAAVAGLFLVGGAAAPAVADERPNIVVILVDDMGFSDIGCYGSEINTPNLDRLAGDGLRFTQFYNNGRCCPTRASLLTGLHPHQVGIGHMTAPPDEPLKVEGPYQGFLIDNCVTIAQVLRDAGYHTLMTGKWHVGANSQEVWPLQRGFDRYFGGLSGAFNYFRPGGNRGLTRGNESVKPGDDFYTTDAFTDEACRYISEATEEDDRPFFLYLAYNAPHWPLNAKVADFERYRGKYTGGWEPLMKARFAKQKELGLFGPEVEAAPHEGPEWDSLRPKRRDNLDAIMAAYAGCIDSIDQNIGKLYAHLESIGEADNTLILFLSDNGACQEGGRLGQGSEAMVRNPPPGVGGVHLGHAWANACNTPFRLYKHFVHEGGMGTPFIAHWPAGMKDAQRGGFVRHAAYLPDVMATCVELASATYPDAVPPCVGKSLAATIKGGDGVIHPEPLYWEHEGNAAVRWGDWKLVRRYEHPWELYDIAKDRTELHDLAEKETAKRDELVAMWEAWATEHGVAFPKRFDMYQRLRELKEAKEKESQKQAARPAAVNR